MDKYQTPMRRTTLILLIVLAIVLLGGGGYLWWKKDSIVWPWLTKNSNTVQTANTTANTAATTSPKTLSVNASLPEEVKGNTALAGALSVGSVSLTISSQQTYTTFNGDTAEKGKEIFVVYFDQVQNSSVTAVDRGLRDVVLTDGKATYAVQSIKIASTAIKGDRGYVQFMVPEKASNLKLQLGSGATLQSIALK